MAELYQELAAGFSTADAAQPEIIYRGGELVLQFADWQEKFVTIRFPFAIAFCWEDEVTLPADVRDDQSYEVQGSCWLSELRELGAAEPQHRHYKLCFNAQGVLDVISDRLQVTV